MPGKVRCLLIYPRFSEFSFWNFSYLARLTGHRYNTPPLGLLTVAALLPEHWECRLADMNVRGLDRSLLEWADVVMTGGMITQQPELLRLIRLAHEHGKPVAVGGPDPTSEPEVYSEADFLVLDEAEATLPAFVRAWDLGRRSGRFESGGLKPDITKTPLPRYDLISPGDYLYMGLQSSRGCPYTCEFCDIIELYGRVPRCKTPEQVLAELSAIYETGHRGHVDFVDDNFIGNKKGVKELLKAVIAWSEERGWPFFFSTEATITLASDPELLELMSRCDFHIVFVGIETPDPGLLRSARKKQNTLAPIAESVRRLNEAGLLVLGGFILGFDEEGPGAGEALAACVKDARIAVALAGLLTSLPNTQLQRRLAREGRQLERPDGRVSADDGDQMTGGLNFITRRPRLEILREYRRALLELYSPRAYFARIRGFLRWYRKTPRHRPGIRQLPSALLGFLSLNLMMLVRPGLWWQYARTLAAGALHSSSGLFWAASMAMMYLHFRRQAGHAVSRLDAQIRELEKVGEEAWLRAVKKFPTGDGAEGVPASPAAPARVELR